MTVGNSSFPASSASRNANRTGVMVTLIAPSPSSIRPRIPSLLQTVLYCDLQGVDLVLDALSKEPGRIIKIFLLLDVCSDFNSKSVLTVYCYG